MITVWHSYTQYTCYILYMERFRNLTENVSGKLKCRRIEDLSVEQLKSRSTPKENLADILVLMGTLIFESQPVLRSAIVKLEDQKSETMSYQKELIEVQNSLIACQNVKLDSVQETVQTEIRTFSDVVKETCTGSGTETFTPAKLKKVVRTAMIDGERPKNFLIFGADEELFDNETKMADEDLSS